MFLKVVCVIVEGIQSSLRLVFYFMSLHFTCSPSCPGTFGWVTNEALGVPVVTLEKASLKREAILLLFLCYWLNFGFMEMLDMSKLLSSRCAITMMINDAFYILVFEIQSLFHSAAF